MRGFTLLELIIAIAIVAILASIAISGYNNYIYKSRCTELVHAASALKPAVTDCLMKNTSSTCVSGAHGIPAAQSTSIGYIASTNVTSGGTIRIVGTSTVNNVSYELRPTVESTGQVTFAAYSSNCSYFGGNCIGTSGGIS